MATTFTTAPVTLTARDRQRRDYANLGLWTLQGWVAMFFIAAGYAKMTESMTNLVELMTWPARVPEALVRGVGIAEIVLALGLLVPLISWKVGRPILLVAAAGLIVLETIMLGVHILDLDIGLSLTNIILLGFTVTVLLGRRSAN